MLNLNYGCGETKLKDYVNIDLEPTTKPDLLLDLRKEPFPYSDDTVDLIQCIHNIEHIERKFWPVILGEFYRVLKPEGALRLAYPEFEVCAKNFLENFRGQRDFWRATLYGRQLYPGDFHVVPMVTSELVGHLEYIGYHNIKSCPEPGRGYNTFLVAKKGPIPFSKEEIIKREIFIK